MNQALWIAKTGMDAQQTRMDVITNNLANASTVGFKRSNPEFEDLLYQNVRQPGVQSSQDTTLPSGLMLGVGVRAVATVKQYSQGDLNVTGNAFDVAITGPGFFQVNMPDGRTAYTRNGAFLPNAEGTLVLASNGFPIEPQIQVNENTASIEVAQDGIVTLVTTQGERQQGGQLEIATFINPAGLEPIGANMAIATIASGDARTGVPTTEGFGGLQGQALEQSNVNVVEELVSMIETQRTYELNSKAISTSDQMLQFLNNNL